MVLYTSQVNKFVDPEGWNRGEAQEYAIEAKLYKVSNECRNNGARHK